MKYKLIFFIGILLLITASMLLLINYSIIFSYFTLAYMLVIAIVAYGYKPCQKKYTPTCDVLIPAFNEGKHIYKTIKSVVKSDYPHFRIIAIDDGSTDDTRQWMEKAKQEFPQITTIYCERNRGKKHALATGIRASDSEIIVTIDSDSSVQPDSLTHLLSPFCDPKVGAVAGNICVQNLHRGLIPKLMDIIFVFSYELLRSSQSRFGTVLCTPGALSAYRRSAVLPLMKKWLNQRFMGRRTSIGEDRALTCMLLQEKWLIRYQEPAKAYTNMPENYVSLCKMLLRWVRGDIRENILLAPYVFRSFSLTSLKSLGLTFHYLIFNIGILSPVVILPVAVGYLIIHYHVAAAMLPYMIPMTLLWSIVPTIVYARKQSWRYCLHAFTYSVYSLFFLVWIPFYALLTLDNNKWLTRK